MGPSSTHGQGGLWRQVLSLGRGPKRAGQGRLGDRRAWGLVHLAAGGDCSLPSPGHVFPEFKESDAMFAAERVSLVPGEGRAALGRRGPGTGLLGAWAAVSCCLR